MFKTLKEIANILGYKDSRSARTWCKNNIVGILCDVGSNKQYILESEFQEARLRATIKHLKQKHDKSYSPDLINYHMHHHAQVMEAISERKSKKGSSPNMGENEKRFLSILSKQITER